MRGIQYDHLRGSDALKLVFNEIMLSNMLLVNRCGPHAWMLRSNLIVRITAMALSTVSNGTCVQSCTHPPWSTIFALRQVQKISYIIESSGTCDVVHLELNLN